MCLCPIITQEPLTDLNQNLLGSLLEPLLAWFKNSKLCMLTLKEKFPFPCNAGFPSYTGNPDLLGVISKKVTLLNLEFLAIVLSPEIVLT